MPHETVVQVVDQQASRKWNNVVPVTTPTEPEVSDIYEIRTAEDAMHE